MTGIFILSSPPIPIPPFFSSLQYSKHLFVHIGQTNPSYSDPLLEAVDIRQIYDKFPEKKGGLKELYEKGPQNAFFLVKFWVSIPKIQICRRSQISDYQYIWSKFLLGLRTGWKPFGNLKTNNSRSILHILL